MNKEKIPDSTKNLVSIVKFEGSKDPSIPINLCFAESISVLKALAGLSMRDLTQTKYKTVVKTITINTDQAQLFLLCTDTNSFCKKWPNHLSFESRSQRD